MTSKQKTQKQSKVRGIVLYGLYGKRTREFHVWPRSRPQVFALLRWPNWPGRRSFRQQKQFIGLLLLYLTLFRCLWQFFSQQLLVHETSKGIVDQLQKGSVQLLCPNFFNFYEWQLCSPNLSKQTSRRVIEMFRVYTVVVLRLLPVLLFYGPGIHVLTLLTREILQ